jgi:hypothetical protein
MKLLPLNGYLTGEWVVIKDEQQEESKFETLEAKADGNIDVALRIVNNGNHGEIQDGDVVFTGVQFYADRINPFGQIIPVESVFAKIDTEGREVQNYVEWANEEDRAH